MRKLKKAVALCLSLLALLTMPVKASAAELREEIIDTGRTGSLTIYKYDITSSEKDGVIDMILAILLFVKIATAYMDYRKHGQFEFTAPAILFACSTFLPYMIMAASRDLFPGWFPVFRRSKRMSSSLRW